MLTAACSFLAHAQRCSASLLSKGARDALVALRPPLSRPANAYACFFAEQYAALRGQNPEGTDIAEAGRRAGAIWRSMNAEQRAKYVAQADTEREAYASARDARNESANETEAIADHALRYDMRYRRGALSRKAIPSVIREFAENLPAAPPATGRALFMGEQMRGRGDAVAIMPQVSAAWDALPEGQKAAYAQRAAAGVATYRQKVASVLSENQFEDRSLRYA